MTKTILAGPEIVDSKGNAVEFVAKKRTESASQSVSRSVETYCNS